MMLFIKAFIKSTFLKNYAYDTQGYLPLKNT